MRLNYYLVPFCTLLVIPTLISYSYAGTSFTGLSGKVTVLDLAEEKRKSDIQQDKASSSIDFYRWALRGIERNIEQPNLFYLDMALVSEQIKREGIDPEFFNKYDRNNLRLAVKSKDYVAAKKIIKAAQSMMQPGAFVLTTSEVIE